MSNLVPETGFAKGAAQSGNQYTAPTDLSYLSQSTASATASGGGTSSNLTGIIPASGSTPTAGTGFTYTHVGGSGSYVFTFTTPFASTPVVLTQIAALTTQYMVVSGITVNGFTANTIVTANGAPQDAAFNFFVVATR